jgi:hypothetical protein
VSLFIFCVLSLYMSTSYFVCLHWESYLVVISVVYWTYICLLNIVIEGKLLKYSDGNRQRTNKLKVNWEWKQNLKYIRYTCQGVYRQSVKSVS